MLAAAQPAPDSPEPSPKPGNHGPDQAAEGPRLPALPRPPAEPAEPAEQAEPAEPAGRGPLLQPGPLEAVVAQIERVYAQTPQEAGRGDDQMPILIYGPGTTEAKIAAPLRLPGMRVVDAVALVAAAAGCTLEPIFSLPQTGDESGPRILGYRFLMAADAAMAAGPGKPGPDVSLAPPAQSSGRRRPAPGMVERDRGARRDRQGRPAGPPPVGEGEAGPLAGIGLAIGKSQDGLVVEQVVPGSPAAAAPAIRPGLRILSVSEAGGPEVEVAGLPLEQVVQLIRGAPGTVVEITFGRESDQGLTKEVVRLVRARLPLPQSGEMPPRMRPPKRIRRDPSGSGPEPGDPARPGPPGGAQPAGPGDLPMVRVYSLGSLVSGSDGARMKLHQLMREALELDGPGQAPQLSFQAEGKVLLVKATARQQKIIDQVISALKESGL